ncbi:MAG: hypothetical protein ACFE9T_10340 [Promethearchaeota archaeon]
MNMISYYFYSKRKPYIPNLFYNMICTFILIFLVSLIVHTILVAHSQQKYSLLIISAFSIPFFIAMLLYTILLEIPDWKKERSRQKRLIMSSLKEFDKIVDLKRLHERWLKSYIPKFVVFNSYDLDKEVLTKDEFSINNLLSLLFELREEKKLNFKYNINTGELLLNEIVQYKPNNRFTKPVKVPRREKKLFLFQKKASQLDYCIYCGQVKIDIAKFCEFCGSRL